jgi:predicted transglutaminase-like cysteine proteinase
MRWGSIRPALVGLFVITCTATAQSQSSGSSRAMPTTGWANAPVGHSGFCRAYPGECVAAATARPVNLDQERWRQLVRINEQVNQAVAPVTDLERYGVEEMWILPTTEGDCEDYVLLKRRTLMEEGWPASALLITVVFDEEGEGHAVLAARTDRGDLILDNKASAIRVWHETAYRYVKRQSEADPKRWVSISDPRWTVGAATASGR